MNELLLQAALWEERAVGWWEVWGMAGRGEHREKPTRVLSEAFPPHGVKSVWSKGANAVQKSGVDGKIMSFT